LMYSNNGIFASAAYEDLQDSAVGGSVPVPDTAWRFGLGWENDSFGIAGVYENQDDITGTNIDADLYQISAKYMFGNNTIKGMWGQADVDFDDNRDGWAVGFDHNLSKRTKAYILYADSENGLRTEKSKGVDAKGFSAGMVHKF